MAGKMEVKLANDVYRCCFHHALSSQAEEVMGILIGEKISEKDGTTVIEGNYQIMLYFVFISSSLRIQITYILFFL